MTHRRASQPAILLLLLLPVGCDGRVTTTARDVGAPDATEPADDAGTAAAPDAAGAASDAGAAAADAGPARGDAGPGAAGTDARPGPRGYAPRDCGFDLDGDGVVGEPEDCRLCDGVTADPDGDGIDEDLWYVDCDAGRDDDACGGPDRPCGTLAHAISQVDGPGDGAEDVICFRGRCAAEPDDLPLVSGVSGSRTRPATGSQVRSFEVPSDPFRIVGWDGDRDGIYPPADDDDEAVLDGAGGLRAFANRRSASWVELAHFRVEGHGSARGDGSLGFFTQDGADDTSHLYFHDLELDAVNRRAPLNSNVCIFNLLGASGLRHLAVENVSCQQCGGYFVRGGLGPDPLRPSGPFRFERIHHVARGCDAGRDRCAGLPSEKSGAHVAKLWGAVEGVEILDSIFDANAAGWDEGSSLTAVIPNACSGAWDIRNNEFLEYRMVVVAQPDDFDGVCEALGRPLGPVTVDSNLVRMLTADDHPKALRFVEIEPGREGGGQFERIDHLRIVNNLVTTAGRGVAQMIDFAGGHDGPCDGGGHADGVVEIAHNTFVGPVEDRSDGAGVLIRSPRSCGHPRIRVLNNLFAGMAPGDVALRVDAAVADLRSDGHVFPSAARLSYRGVVGDLEAFRSRSGQDASSRACAPTFAPAGPPHLSPGDECARGAGVPLGSVAVDFEGDPRAHSAPDVGADESAAAGGP